MVGADGIRSTIARCVGAGSTRSGRHVSATTYGYWSDLDTDGYEWIFRTTGCAGVIPTNGGETCVFAIASPGRIGRGGTRVLEEIVAASAPDLAERLRRAVAPRATRTWSGHSGFIRRSHGPGWALVGDAGYYKDPISAHGLTDALRDAELLARAVVAGQASAAAMDEALAGYQQIRDRLSIPLFDVVDRIAGLQWDTKEIADLLVRLSSSMAAEVETLAALEPMSTR